MNVTVAICTWNRADLLDQTLTGMRGLRVPPGLSWEVVVVNNNCTDHTDAMVARHTDSLPLRCVQESTPGLSHARNRAIAESTGDLIVFADDDVLVDTEWLAEYAAAVERFPEAGVFGGTIDPWFATKPPKWVQRHLNRLDAIYAVRQLGADVRPLEPGEEVYGANIAFRRAALTGLRFNPAFGRNQGEMLHGEETDLMARVLAAGWVGVWVGTAKLRHFIPARRTTAAYVRSYFAGVGRTNQRREGAPATDVPLLLGMPRWMVRRFVSERVRAAVLTPFRDEAWLDSLRTSAMLWGRMAECRAMARKATHVPSPFEGGGLGWGLLEKSESPPPTPTLPHKGGRGPEITERGGGVSSRVSVVIATFNCGQFLAEAIESALNQTLPSHEVIVVDDGSTDNTSAILDAFGDRIRAVKQANAGVSTARNRGCELATGEYLAIMDADDVCRPERFAEQVAFLDRHPEVVAVGCQMERVDAAGQPLGKIAYATDDATIRFRMLTNSSLPHPGTTLRRADLVAIGGYDPDFPSCQDYDMWCRLSARGKFANLPTTLLNYRWHGKNITITAANKGSERAREISRRHLLRSGFATTPAEADAFYDAYTGLSVSLTRDGAAACHAVWTRFLGSIHDPALRAWLRSVCLACAEECSPTRAAFLRWVSLARAVDPEQMRWDRLAGRVVSNVCRKVFGTREGVVS